MDDGTVAILGRVRPGHVRVIVGSCHTVFVGLIEYVSDGTDHVSVRVRWWWDWLSRTAYQTLDPPDAATTTTTTKQANHSHTHNTNHYCQHVTTTIPRHYDEEFTRNICTTTTTTLSADRR